MIKDIDSITRVVLGHFLQTHTDPKAVINDTVTIVKGIVDGLNGTISQGVIDLVNFDNLENVWAKELKAGDKVRVFGIPCIGFDGTETIIYTTPAGELFIVCDDGRHFIDGQWDDEHKHYVGIKFIA